jgi:hypothetical protein
MIPPFFNIFSESKTEHKLENKIKNQEKIKKPRKNKKRNTLKKIPKKVTFGISVQQTGFFYNKNDCLEELKKPENKGGKCILISIGRYIIEKKTKTKE